MQKKIMARRKGNQLAVLEDLTPGKKQLGTEGS